MSLLDDNDEDLKKAKNTQRRNSETSKRAVQLFEAPSAIFQSNLINWQLTMTSLWGMDGTFPRKRWDDTKKVLKNIGTDASELFVKSNELLQFLESQKEGITSSREVTDYLDLMFPYIIQEDGSIILDEDAKPLSAKELSMREFTDGQ